VGLKMSLNPKKQKTTKKISVVGTEEDMLALADVLKQTKQMFNIDITGKGKNLPIRITIRDEAEPEAVSYPRTARALKVIVKALEKEIPISDTEVTTPVSIGDMDWIWNDPTRTDCPTSVRVLQSITRGTNVAGLRPIDPAKHYAGRDITQELDIMLDYPKKWPQSLVGSAGTNNGIFEVLKPEWTYIQSADVWPVESKKWKGKDLNIQEIRRLDEDRREDKAVFPPELGKADGGELTQAIVVAFRGDRDLDPLEKINVDAKVWSNFVKRLPTGMLSKELTKEKPKTIGDMLKVFIAYNVASFMKYKDVTVKPIGPGKASISSEFIDGSNRVPIIVPGQPPQRQFKEKILYSALVVGDGTAPDDVDLEHMVEQNIPGWN
jgi:hypothetical protein